MFTFLIIALVSFSSVLSQSNYCNVPSCGDPSSHIACNNSGVSYNSQKKRNENTKFFHRHIELVPELR